MKSLKLFSILLFVLLGASNVSAQCDTSQGKIKKTYSDGSTSVYPEIKEKTRSYGDPYEKILVCGCGLRFVNPKRSSYIGGGTVKYLWSPLKGNPPYAISVYEDYNLVANAADAPILEKYYFPKTWDYFSKFVTDNSRCFNDDEFAVFKILLIMDEASLNEQDKEREDKANKELEERKIENQKFCKGVPKIQQVLIEKISNVGNVDPQLVRLNRVEVTGAFCNAIFYTPKGVARAYVRFNGSGVIDTYQNLTYPR